MDSGINPTGSGFVCIYIYIHIHARLRPQKAIFGTRFPFFMRMCSVLLPSQFSFCLRSLSVSLNVSLSFLFCFSLSISLSFCFASPLPPSLIDWLDQLSSLNFRLFLFCLTSLSLSLSLSLSISLSLSLSAVCFLIHCVFPSLLSGCVCVCVGACVRSLVLQKLVLYILFVYGW